MRYTFNFEFSVILITAVVHRCPDDSARPASRATFEVGLGASARGAGGAHQPLSGVSDDIITDNDNAARHTTIPATRYFCTNSMT